ncbi:MAG: hypothetical protein Q9201_001389 [Fulgogasparrea decipioides]
MSQKHMRLFVSILVLACLSCCSSISSRGNEILSTHNDLPLTKRANRQLRAAQVESHIGKRSTDQALRRNHELHYVDDTLDIENRRLAAQVRVTAKLPTLLLEDIDHHVSNVNCAESHIVLGFGTTLRKRAALAEIGVGKDFYLVTSHDTCNVDGERSVYLVSTVSATSDDLNIVLSVSRVSWKSAIQTIKIDVGKSKERYRIRKQGEVQKRQMPSSAEASIVATPGAAASTVAFPVPPSSTPTATSAHKDVSFSYADTPLLPPAFPGVDSATLNVPFIPNGVSIKCKNCTVTGTIDILQGSVLGNTTNSSEDDDFSWDQGSFTFEANGFSAHIQLEATIQPSADLLSFEAPMPTIGLPGFSIPGVGTVGPIFKPAIVIGTQISSELEFTYGFNLTVPNNSSILLDLTDPEDSTVNGFPNSQITALPFTSSVNNIALTVSAAFRPELLLGISVLTGILGAGVFFNLPTVSATISQVAHVNSKCEPLPIPSSSATTNDNSSTIVDGVVEDVFGSLTHVEPEVELDFGVLAEAKLGAGGKGVEGVVTVFNTSFALPTTCLSFDEEEKTLGPVAAKTTGKEGGGKGAVASKKNEAGRGWENPLTGIGSVSGMIWGLFGVSLIFVGL